MPSVKIPVTYLKSQQYMTLAMDDNRSSLCVEAIYYMGLPQPTTLLHT